VEEAYGRRGRAVVERNFAAIDAALDALAHVDVPTEETVVAPAAGGLGSTVVVAGIPDDAPLFVQEVTRVLPACDGGRLPLSALLPDVTCPSGTARYEKRAIAREIPIWDPDIFIDVG